ncbi:MAG: PspA/IM30 family protein [Candidatus Marsarchaeota archaeon]|nr:PspA/IM30 family protein [Candidatus Marsarchaeota archaeon]MDA8081244.1 PspA/IM30 family protein [Actinomycetota bacterium]
MSLFKRMSQVFQQKANAALNKAEDPTQALDLSYQKMLENLQQVRRSIADVLTSQKRLEAQQATLSAQYDKLQGQARQALQQGQEDLAKTALTRSTTVKSQIDQLTPQIEQLKTQEQSLEDTGQKLQAKLELFRSQKDTMKAQYTAAKASTSAMEGLTGLSENMTDVSMMIDRAQDKITGLQARAAAVSELADTGVLDNLAIGSAAHDDIEAQLQAASPSSDVEFQLEAMKAQMGIGTGTSPQPEQKEVAAGESMVIRITGDSVYEVPASVRPALDNLDDALDKAITHNDQEAFSKSAEELIKLIHAMGKKLPETDLRHSDLIVPSHDMTIEQAKKMLDEGSQG